MSKSGCGIVLEPRFLIAAFFEDVITENTTFAFPEGAEPGSKLSQSPVPLVVHQFETIVISRIDFGVARRALARGLRRFTPWRRAAAPPAHGFKQLLLRQCENAKCFCIFQKTSILTPRTLSFSLVFLLSVSAQCPVDAAGSTAQTRNWPRHLS